MKKLSLKTVLSRLKIRKKSLLELEKQISKLEIQKKIDYYYYYDIIILEGKDEIKWTRLKVKKKT